MKNTKTITLPSREFLTPHEVTIHYKRPLFSSMIHISSVFEAVKCFHICVEIERIDHKEFFWILLLNNSNRVLGFAEIGSGTDTKVIINYREIFQLVLKINAKNIIVAHNHPSGNLKASKADNQVTFKLRKMAELIGIRLLDHIIITSEDYISIMK